MKRLSVLLLAFLVASAAMDSVEDEDSSAVSSEYSDDTMDLKKMPKPKKCKDSSDCEPTHTCKTVKLFGKKKVKVCVRKPCPPSSGPRTAPCSSRCRCGRGQGPCGSHATCRPGLRCLGEPGKCGKPEPKGQPNGEPTGTEAPVDTSDSTNEDRPYDLADQCASSTECPPGQVCRNLHVHSAGSRVKLCMPKLPQALDDEDSVWEFFEDAADDDVSAQDLGKKKRKKCKSQADCKPPAVCLKPKGKKKGKCVVMPCPPPVGPRTRPCTTRCKCGLGQGKCSSSAVCRPPLKCDNGKCVHTLVPKATKPAPPSTTAAAADFKDDVAALNALSASKSDSNDDSLDVVPDNDMDDLVR